LAIRIPNRDGLPQTGPAADRGHALKRPHWESTKTAKILVTIAHTAQIAAASVRNPSGNY
jgi:hypothetical protein